MTENKCSNCGNVEIVTETPKPYTTIVRYGCKLKDAPNNVSGNDTCENHKPI